jgi:hypothetical protein
LRCGRATALPSPVSADPRPRRPTQALAGARVELTKDSGEQFEGVFHTATPFEGRPYNFVIKAAVTKTAAAAAAAADASAAADDESAVAVPRGATMVVGESATSMLRVPSVVLKDRSYSATGTFRTDGETKARVRAGDVAGRDLEVSDADVTRDDASSHKDGLSQTAQRRHCQTVCSR